MRRALAGLAPTAQLAIRSHALVIFCAPFGPRPVTPALVVARTDHHIAAFFASGGNGWIGCSTRTWSKARIDHRSNRRRTVRRWS